MKSSFGVRGTARDGRLHPPRTLYGMEKEAAGSWNQKERGGMLKHETPNKQTSHPRAALKSMENVKKPPRCRRGGFSYRVSYLVSLEGGGVEVALDWDSSIEAKRS